MDTDHLPAQAIGQGAAVFLLPFHTQAIAAPPGSVGGGGAWVVPTRDVWGLAEATDGGGAVEATNSGRLGTEIQQFGFPLPNGRHIQNIYDFLGQPVQLPMPLGPGRTATMTYAAEHIREALRGEAISGKRVRPYVTTGHGRVEGRKMHLGKWIEHLHH